MLYLLSISFLRVPRTMRLLPAGYHGREFMALPFPVPAPQILFKIKADTDLVGNIFVRVCPSLLCLVMFSLVLAINLVHTLVIII